MIYLKPLISISAAWDLSAPCWLRKGHVLNRTCSVASTLQSLPLGASCSCISRCQSQSSGFKPGMTLVYSPQGQYWCGLINIKGWLWSSGLIFLASRTCLDLFLFEPQYGKASHPDLKISSNGKVYHNFCNYQNFCKFFQRLIRVAARRREKEEGEKKKKARLHLFSFSFQATWGEQL